ncbi:uncharacterized protein PITG_14963 [Phytophthora infestans T30-4]|uniref:Uncharacterized protein n=1 Tax=Phytophthora infestans (strain T30-4) TaxID=403677 RepID=D0NPF2_PHYIT|nr:uncharacterized protein PITG_14963 [Phytophthora infestans T30-4]EEY62494.1 conserved hypothetical protein [Phytophthora infestans T30-4]|eukprot:XP_002899130.1 conserved hypothetical protein [Phytophthora infestans T30-4]
MIRQKMASSIILAALDEKIAAEVYLLDHPMAILRHLRMTYNVKCSASVGAAKREYIGLYLDGDNSMIDHIKNTRRVIDELQEQRSGTCLEWLRWRARVLRDIRAHDPALPG